VDIIGSKDLRRSTVAVVVRPSANKTKKPPEKKLRILAVAAQD